QDPPHRPSLAAAFHAAGLYERGRRAKRRAESAGTSPSWPTGSASSGTGLIRKHVATARGHGGGGGGGRAEPPSHLPPCCPRSRGSRTLVARPAEARRTIPGTCPPGSRRSRRGRRGRY